MNTHRKTLGHNGEAMAAQYLQQQGYYLLAKNWRYGRVGELDLIALTPDKQTLVAIEVKTALTLASVSALEQVTPKKIEKLAHLLQAFVMTHPEHEQLCLRLDAIVIQGAKPLQHIIAI